MANTTHHRQQFSQPTSQMTVASHPQVPNTLPPWTHTPLFLTFAPCLVAFCALMIRHRMKLHRRGERFTRRKTKPAEYLGFLLVLGALFYFRDSYPIIRLVMEWPDRTFPYYREHSMAMWAGFMAAGLLAVWISAAFAMLFLRPGARGSGRSASNGLVADTSGHVMMPNPLPDHGWYPRRPASGHRIIGTRTTYEGYE